MDPLRPLPYIGMGIQTAPLTLEQAIHLYRRTSFGASEATIQAAVGRPASDVVNEIVDAAINNPIPPEPPWQLIYGGTPAERSAQQREMKYGVFRNMFERGLQEKMMFFWYDHFGTNYREHNRPSFTNKANQLYRAKGLGDFFELLSECGKGPDMLRFLNGWQSRVGGANENYAREVLELFTMSQYDLDGNVNYTETDIIEAADALTGWQINNTTIEGFFNSGRWDPRADKTIFGVTGAHDFDDVMGLIKSERGDQTAQYICTKLYQLFVYQEPNRSVINAMVNTFIASDFDIGTVVKRILRSPHFFQDKARGVKYKDPTETFVVSFKEAEMTPDDDTYNEGTFRRMEVATQLAGMIVLENPDVSGPPGHRAWAAIATIGNKWDQGEKLIKGVYSDITEQNLTGWAQTACGGSTNPTVIAQEIAKRIFSRPIDAELMVVLEDAFKGNIPDEEFDNGTWDWFYPDAHEQVNNMLIEAYRFPEYHLI